MHLSRVCLAWYGGANIGKEVAVKDHKTAKGLAAWLDRASAERKDRVRSLNYRISPILAHDQTSFVSVVSSCRQLEVLQLLGVESFGGVQTIEVALETATEGHTKSERFEMNAAVAVLSARLLRLSEEALTRCAERLNSLLLLEQR